MPSMKKAVSIFLLAACAAHAEPQTEAVACLGRVVPGDRIAKLTAVSPTGGQPVIKKLFVKKGDFVEEGAPVAEMEGIDKARASLKRAEAVLSAAKSASDIRLQQQRNLIADMRGSFDQNAKILDEQSPSRREKAEIEYEQESLSRKIGQAEGMLKLVEKNEANVVAEAESALAEAKEHFDEFTLKAPISGEILELNAERGESVGSDGVCEIADTKAMFVNAEVYVADVSKIKLGDKAAITSDALGDKAFSGSVVQISRYVKSNRIFSTNPSDYSNTRVVVAKIKLDDPSMFRNLIGSQVDVRIFVR